MNFLGLDVSTTCTGYAILDDKEAILCSGFVDLKNLKKYKNLYDKADKIEQIIDEKNINIDYVVIENPLKGFMYGKTSSQTLSLLSRFNGMISLMFYKKYHIVPELLSFSTARAKLKVKQLDNKTIKEAVLYAVQQWYPDFKFILNRNNNIDAKSYDEADAILLTKAFIKEKMNGK